MHRPPTQVPVINLSAKGPLGMNGVHDVRLVSRYLNLLEASLIGTLLKDAPMGGDTYDSRLRGFGLDWPTLSISMIGAARMDNLRHCCETALRDGIPGDFIETGVWRGGATIMMRGILAAYGETTRRVFVADSFAGLPPPDAELFPADINDNHHTIGILAVSIEEVRENFRRYELLDDQVVFLKGWFKDTLPTAPIEQISVLRLDGDMYESTIDALNALYHKVPYGGFVIIDDYVLGPCAQAVTDFRAFHEIESLIRPIDGTGVWWRVDHGPIDH